MIDLSHSNTPNKDDIAAGVAELAARFVYAGAGIILGRFAHDCGDEDIVDEIGGQRCRVCDRFVSEPDL